MNTTLAAMGHPVWGLEQTRQRVRRSLREAFPEMFGDRWEEARDVFYRRFREIHLDYLTAQPAAEALIQSLASKGVYLGVVSNKAGEHLRREVQHLGWDGRFGQLVGATDAVRDKPAVEAVELALTGSGTVRGRDVWFCGDTWIDMQCALNAGCVAVLVNQDEPLEPEFRSFPPEHRFRDCEHLLSLVTAL